MTQPPPLFDRALRRRRRDRAAPRFAEAAYLHDEAAAGIADRLAPVTRPFPDAAVLADADGRYARALRGRFGIERLRAYEAAPALAALGGAATGDVEAGSADGAAGAPPAAPPSTAPSPAWPLAPESQDLVVIGLELHAVNDPVGVLAQARRSLRPDGLMLAALFGGETLTELRAALAEAEAAVSDGLSPRVAPMAELRAAGGLLQRAGFALPVADSDRLTIWQPSPLHLMRDLRAMGETNVLTARRRSGLRRDLLAEAVARYQAAHARADGKVRATVEILYLSGWAPAAHQQKPLRPGSAAARLADALGAEEISAGEKPGSG